MTIKFINPESAKQDYLKELENIVEKLQKKPDPVLQKNMKFVRSFTRALFLVSAKRPKQSYFGNIPTQPIQQPRPVKIKPKLEPLPPPPSPPLNSPQPLFKKEDNVLNYRGQEPELTEKDKQIYNKISQKVQESPDKKPDEEIKKAAQQMNLQISQPYIDKIRYHLEKNLKKYNVLTPLIEEPRVSAIDISSFNNIQAVYDNEQIPTNIKFSSKRDFLDFQKSLANKFNYPIKKESQINIQTPELKITGIHSNYSPTLKIEKPKQ